MAGGTTDDAPVPTLGERLADQGRALAARHLTAFPWSGPLAVAMQRAAALDVAHEERFARIEVDVAARRPRPGGARPPRAWPAPAPGLPDPVRLASGETAPRMAGRAGTGRLADGSGVAAGSGTSRPAATRSTAPGVDGPVPLVPSPVAAPPAPGGEPDAPGRPLEPAVRSRLRSRVGPAADLVQVHDGPAADALARSHGADAVTVGTDVHFQKDRYRPADVRGFGLLVHEAGHVQAALAPGASSRRATGPGRAEEEQRVMAGERAALAGASGSRPAGVPPPAVAAPVAPVPAAVSRHPTPTTGAMLMAAAVDRDVDASAEPGAASAALTAQLASLRRELVEHVLGDLRRRLRTESERGG